MLATLIVLNTALWLSAALVVALLLVLEMFPGIVRSLREEEDRWQADEARIRIRVRQ